MFFCTYECPWHILAYNRSYAWRTDTAICNRIFGWYCDLLQIYRRTQLPRPQSHNTLKWNSCYLVIGGVQIFRGNDWISWSCHTPKAPWDSVTDRRRHPRARTVYKPDQTQIVLRIKQRIQTVYFNLRAYSCSVKPNPLQGPATNFQKTQQGENELLEYA